MTHRLGVHHVSNVGPGEFARGAKDKIIVSRYISDEDKSQKFRRQIVTSLRVAIVICLLLGVLGCPGSLCCILLYSLYMGDL